MECLNSKSAGELINRILPGSRLLISSLPDLALKTHVELLDKPCDVKKAFSKPCLVNFISKDTHLGIFYLPVTWQM